MEQLKHNDLIMPVSEIEGKYARKIIPSEMLPVIREKNPNSTIVFGSGCFDLIHAGHFDFLLESRMQGDILVIGINSNESVRRLKGEDRPIVGQENRARIIAGFGVVDYVFLFDSLDVDEYMEILRPDVYSVGVKDVSLPQDKPELVMAKKLGTKVYVSHAKDSEESTTELIRFIEETDPE